MRVHKDFEQNSLAWLTAKAGVVTASEFGEFLDSDFDLRKGVMPRTYIARKLAEKWIGGPLPGFSTLDTEFGQIFESECLPWYEFTYGEKVERVAFITSDDGRIGCSPDGILGPDLGLEVKCPRFETQVKYLLDGALPKEYAPQVHGSLYVTGFSRWRFVSYSRRLPPLLLTIERDEEIQAKISAALKSILASLDSAYKRLVEINGGEPKRLTLPNTQNEVPIEDIIP